MSTREHSSPNRAGGPAFKEGDRAEFIEDYGSKVRGGDRGDVMVVENTGLVGVDLDGGGMRIYAFDHRMKLVEEPASEPTEWTPGEGWLEVRSGERPGEERLIWSAAGSSTPGRVWVREEPVPPLPTEPHTVIQTCGRKGFSDWEMKLDADGLLWRNTHVDTTFEPDELPRYITGFEVLSTPQAATATAVVEFIQQALRDRRIGVNGLSDVLSNARHEFGAAL